jgi:hypothetical protein
VGWCPAAYGEGWCDAGRVWAGDIDGRGGGEGGEGGEEKRFGVHVCRTWVGFWRVLGGLWTLTRFPGFCRFSKWRSSCRRESDGVGVDVDENCNCQ